MENTTGTCADCGATFKPTQLTPGYAITQDNRKICYECCAAMDRATMDTEGKINLYLSAERGPTHPKILRSSSQGWHVGNWPGTLVYPVMGFPHQGRHNIAGTRYDVWFRDHKKELWHGVQYGENTQICHCKRIKDQWWHHA